MVETVTLEDYGVKVVLISTGAAILSIYTPDRNGQLDDIVLGHPNVEDYAVCSALPVCLNLSCFAVCRQCNRNTLKRPDDAIICTKSNKNDLIHMSAVAGELFSCSFRL